MTYEPVTLESLLTHQGWALRVARRLVREEGEAEDLVQRTWMAALRRPPDTERGARAWIRKVILNLARERHRRNETRVRHERASVGIETHAPDALETASRSEIRALLGQHLLALNEPYRSVLLQRFYEGLSSVEIAARLGIPQGTVRWRLKVGLDQLRAELDKKSHGDRSRWVSALLVLVPPEAAALDPDDEPGLDDPDPAGTASTGLGTIATWIGLAAASVFGGWWLLHAREPAPLVPAFVAGASAEDTARTSVDTTPAERAPTRTALEVPSAPPSVAAATETRARLSIRVLDPEGAAVPAASVWIAGADGYERRAETDADGLARLALEEDDAGALGLALTAGRVSVRALASGRVASPLVHVAPPFTAEHEVRLVVGGPETRLAGRALDADGHGVAHALVAWLEPQNRIQRRDQGDFPSPSYLATRTDADGRFELANLPARRGNVYAWAPGYAALLATPAAEGELVLHMERGAAVHGQLRWPDGRPAAHVRVGCEPLLRASEWATGLPRYEAEWRGFHEFTYSDENGFYRLEGVTAGPRTLFACTEQGRDGASPGWARAGENELVATTQLALENGAEVAWDGELAERQGFRLRLLDEVGAPLAGWTVYVRRPIGSGAMWVRRRAADAEGRIRIADCPEAEVFVDVFDPSGIGAAYSSCRLKPGPEEQPLTVRVHDTCELEGRVVDAAGAPELGGVLVLHSLTTTHELPVERDERGEFALRLAPGKYALVLQLPNTAARLAAVELAAGEERALGLLQPPAMGTLRVTGAALANGSQRTPAFALFALLEEKESRALKVGGGELGGEGGGEVVLGVYAGRYRLLSLDGAGSAPRAYLVTVEPFAETRIALEP